ncbi:MAG TPA: tetratricopeptide repeat protein, partial [Tepidisphaeraceae bacterium]
MERTTPVVGLKRVGVAAPLVLAAALAAGALTGVARGAQEKPAAANAPAKRAPAKPAPSAPVQQQQQQPKQQPADSDAQAAAILNDAKQAFEQKNYGPSVAKYREFLQKFPNRPEALAAQYGLGIALAQAPDRDWNAVIVALTPVVASDKAPDKGRAHYWLGVALRATAEQELAPVNDPRKVLTDKAKEKLARAAAELSAADSVLAGSINAKSNAEALELAAGAKVASAEALNELGRHKEAAEVAKVFASDATWSKSAQRSAGLVALGEAQVALGDYPHAFVALAQVAPFDQIGTGLEARYLLGRIQQETGERPEAVVQYEAVIKGYLEQRRKAEQSLRDKQHWQDRPIEQMRAQALVRSTPPAYVAQAGYEAGTIQFEYGQFAEAAAKYQSFLQGAPRSEHAPLAQLREGICYVQLKQSAEAQRALQPFLENPAFADQATWWMARLLRGQVEPAAAGQHHRQLQSALLMFARAADKAQQLGKTDPAAKARRGDILIDLADTMVLLKQYKDAAPFYEQVAGDPSNPERAEIAHEKWAMALSRDGQFAGSDAACKKFLDKYPRSMLRPSVMYWQAENAYRQGTELAKKPDANTPAVQEQIKKFQEQAAAQYQAVVDKYPEFAQASSARFGLGMAYYRQGEFAKAAKQLERILDNDRVGELAAASYFQADSLIKTMPENADDALSAARLSGQLEQACNLLSAFVGGEERPETPDAMLKLADCYQRQAGILADQQEKAKAFQSARETYDRLLKRYPKHPAYAQAVMDRARCMAATGDSGSAINELNRFRNDTALASSEVAPQALIKLSELMVHNGRAVDAAAMLEKARATYEPQLAKDPKRADWIPGLRYQHAVALKESGRGKDALALFDAIIREFKDRPEAAEASLASIQVRKDEVLAKLKSARQAIAAIPVDKPVDASLSANETEAIKAVTEIANALGEHAERIAEKSEGSDLHVRTLRDAASSWKAIADAEIETARRAKAEESLKKLKERLAKEPSGAAGKSNSVPRPPQIKLASIPVTPAEQKARELYNKALDAAPDSPICNEMRLQLAQMYYDRGEADPAIQLLTAAIEKSPPPELAQQLHIKLGNACLLKKDANAALQQALAALEDANSPLRPAAYLVKGKAQMAAKDWGNAITTLSRYRAGAEKYVNAGPVTEEGLVRLAEAYAAAGSWEESRATYEHLTSRFGQTKWLPEARFGIGMALQHLGQFDRAVEAYQDVVRRTSSEM